MTPQTTTVEPIEARTPPHDLAAEKAVLGALLVRPGTFDDVAEVLDERHFYRAGHRQIFAAMKQLVERDIAIDVMTVKDALGTAGTLEDVGGFAYVSALTDGVPRSLNAVHYAGIVRRKADRRAILAAAQRMIDGAFHGDDEDAEAVLEEAEQALFDIGQGTERGGFVSLADIMPKVLDRLEAWGEAKTGITGVASGFHALDDMTAGFQKGDLVIVAARPSMGKTALCQNIARNAAKVGHQVGVFSLEQDKESLGVRELAAEAQIDGARLRRGQVWPNEWSRVTQAVGTLAEARIHIDDTAFLTAFQMRSRARRLKQQHGLDLLIIDYVQLMVGHEKRENRTLELASISRTLKAMARDLDVPVIALSQLSRKVEERTDKKPMLSDLRESGALEQDADVVLFIYRESVYHKTEDNQGLAEIIVGKQRNGPIGTVCLGWIKEHTKFVNLAPDGYADQHLPMGDR